MRKVLKLGIALAVLSSVSATGSTTEFYQYKDGSASSYFSIADPGGCIRTDIWAYAYESLTKSGPGGFESAPALRVTLSRFDWCNMGYLMYAFGESAGAKVLVSRAITSAAVQGTVEVYDYVGGTLSTVDVDLTWSGSGPWSGSRDHSLYYGPHTRTIAEGSSRHRQAEVAGTVFHEGTNLVAGSPGEGEIWFERGRFVTITPLVLDMPAIAEADEFFSYRGGCAYASFLSTDPTGCITTDIFVSACDSRERYGAGGYQPTPWLGMNIGRTDWCNSQELMQANGGEATGLVQITNALNGATAKGSIELYDTIQGSSFTVEVDLTWTATGPFSGRRDHFRSSFPADRYMSKETGKFRNAEASGTALYEGTNLLAGPSQSGHLFFGQGMTIRWPVM